MSHLDEVTLHELADGTAAPDVVSACTVHLDTCTTCQVELQSIRGLRAQLAALPRADEARPETWTRIAARIGAPRADVVPLAPRDRHTARWVALAAGIVLATTAVVRIATTLETRTDASSRIAMVDAPVAPVDALAAFERSRASYEAAAEELMRTLEARRGELRPETLEVVEKNLAVIDGAIEEIRRALAADPTSAELAFLLTSTWETKLGLLRRATELPGRT